MPRPKKDDLETVAVEHERVDLGFTAEDGSRGFGTLISSSKHVVVWQPIGDPDRAVYEPSIVNRQNLWRDYLSKVDRDGNKVFFLKTELPRGWRPRASTVVPKFKCPVCRKKYPEYCDEPDGRTTHGFIKLQGHVSGFHPRQYRAVYEEAMNNRVKSLGILDMSFDYNSDKGSEGVEA